MDSRSECDCPVAHLPCCLQLTCLACDEAGEVVCAGSMDPFSIYVWAMQTGKLTDVLTGHEAPVSGLCFSTAAGLLASSSWDKTVRYDAERVAHYSLLAPPCRPCCFRQAH